MLKVQGSTILLNTTTANYEFIVLPCEGAALIGDGILMYRCRQRTATPGASNHTTKQQDTH